jgi:hypothetical protein
MYLEVDNGMEQPSPRTLHRKNNLRSEKKERASVHALPVRGSMARLDSAFSLVFFFCSPPLLFTSLFGTSAETWNLPMFFVIPVYLRDLSG